MRPVEAVCDTGGPLSSLALRVGVLGCLSG